MRNRLFISIFIVILLVPSLGLFLFGPAQPAANETLADVPSLTGADGGFNTAVLDEVTDWMADHFALRQELVTAERQLETVLFHESGEEDVILGRDGWLFYAETLDDYQGVNTMTDREVQAAVRTLSLMQEYCEGKDIAFLFTVAPNKNTLYGAYMPSRYTAADRETRNLTRVAAAIAEAGVCYADLYAMFSAEEDTLYRRQDSHWNTRGASLAGDAVLEALGKAYEPFREEPWETVYEEVGDLYEMVYPTGTRLDEDQRYLRDFTFEYVRAIRSTGDNTILTANADRSESLVMYRDSFGNTLHAYLAEAFGAAYFSRITPYDLTLLDTQQADTMIVELAERNLSWLNELAPVFPAPVRDAPQIAAAETAGTQQTLTGVSLSAAACAQMTEYIEVTGRLPSAQLDADSPVYLVVGDTIYEATPAGETAGPEEAPFTAYIPAGAARDGVLTAAVVVLRDGEPAAGGTIDVQVAP